MIGLLTILLTPIFVLMQFRIFGIAASIVLLPIIIGSSVLFAIEIVKAIEEWSKDNE